MFELVKKDFLLILPKRKKQGRVANALFAVIFVALFLVLEVFLFVSVLNKVSVFGNASETLLAAFLLVALIASIISGLLRAEKLFFNSADIRQVGAMPISSTKFILSKLFVFFVLEIAVNYLFSYPLLLAYAVVKQMPTWFYFLSLAYPFCSFILESGFLLLFIIPLHVIIKTLQKHPVFFAIVAIMCTLVAVFVYYITLSLFIGFVTDKADALFTSHNIEVLNSIFNKVVPLIWMVRAFILGDWTNLVLYIVSAVLLMCVGLLVCLGAYSPSMRYQPTAENKAQKLVYRKTSVTAALIKKEISILTYSARLFSFMGLLIVQPFLLYLVVNALNRIFTSGIFQFYTSYVPQIIPFTDMLMVLLFTLTINQGANNYLSVENKMISRLNTLPVSYTKQMVVKLLIPYILSCASLVASCVVLFATGTTSLTNSVCTVLLSAVLLCAFELASLSCEIHNRRSVLYIYLYLLPVAFWAVSIVLSYFGLHTVLVTAIGIVLFALSALPYILRYVKKAQSSMIIGGDE